MRLLSHEAGVDVKFRMPRSPDDVLVPLFTGLAFIECAARPALTGQKQTSANSLLLNITSCNAVAHRKAWMSPTRKG